MEQTKFDFVTKGFLQLAEGLNADAKGEWGKMNGQQMIEHVSGFFRISNGKLSFSFLSSPEHLVKLREFLLSDKEFRENTKAPMLPDESFAVKNNSVTASIDELKNEIKDFVQLFENNPGLQKQHPVFGDLNFEEWILLHYKHMVHHAKQFELI